MSALDLFAEQPADDTAGKLAASKRAYAELRLKYDALWGAGNDLLRAMRTDNGACAVCGADEGRQHKKTCAAWPFIESRLALYD